MVCELLLLESGPNYSKQTKGFFRSLKVLYIALKYVSMLSHRILFQHNNVWPHTANQAVGELEPFHWQIFYHPPITLIQLSVITFLSFTLNPCLHCKGLQNDNKLQIVLLTGLNNWWQNLQEGRKKLVKRFKECVKSKGTMQKNCK